jgi:hypothetical protein
LFFANTLWPRALIGQAARCPILGKSSLTMKRRQMYDIRGGTAIHKLYLSPQKRFSEDIDLVQIRPEGIGPTLFKLRETLAFLGEPKTKRKANNNLLVYSFEATEPPFSSHKLKIEINCREHFSTLGYTNIPFAVNSPWFSGECRITTYEFEELIGTKVRALYQRRKGRDLFDLYLALKNRPLDLIKTIECYREYISFAGAAAPSGKQFLSNLEEKMQDRFFRSDVSNIIGPEIKYDPDEAFAVVCNALLPIMT